MEKLCNDFNIVAPDTPGFGLSDPPANISIDEIAAIFVRFLEDIDAKDANIFGHHTGAVFAAAVAARARHLRCKLALCGPPLLDAEFRKKLPSLALDEPLTSDGSHLKRMWGKFGRKANDISPDIIQREIIQAMYCGANNKRMYQAIADYDLASDLKKMPISVLTFAGIEGVLLPLLDEAHRITPHSKKITVPGGASYICDTHTEELAQLLKHFYLDSTDRS